MAQGKIVLRTCYGNPKRIGFRDLRTGTIYSGSMAASRDGSDMVEEPSARTDLMVIGVVNGGFSFTAATDRAKRVQIDTGTYGLFANSAGADEITANDLGKVCYAVDGTTVSKTDQTGTLSPAGYIRYVLDDGGVGVDFSEYENIAAMRLGGVL